MASERILNEYDSTRIANAVDTLAENLAGYEAGTPATPTDAMKAKLPSQSTGDRISDAMEGLAQGLTNISHPQRISYEDWSALTPQEKANGTQYYIYDYPSVDGSLYAPVTSVATPENGDTASKAYAVGEMFIRGGKLCTCLVAIAQDGTFVKDTNYKEGDVGSVLTELNSKIDDTVTISTLSENISSVVYTTLKIDSKLIISLSFVPSSNIISEISGFQLTGFTPTRSTSLSINSTEDSVPNALGFITGSGKINVRNLVANKSYYVTGIFQ